MNIKFALYFLSIHCTWINFTYADNITNNTRYDYTHTKNKNTSNIKYKINVAGTISSHTIKTKSTNRALHTLRTKLVQDLFLVPYDFPGTLKEDATCFSKLAKNIDAWLDYAEKTSIFSKIQPLITLSIEKHMPNNTILGMEFSINLGHKAYILEPVFADVDNAILKKFSNIYKRFSNIIEQAKLDDIETSIVGNIEQKHRASCIQAIKFAKTMFNESIWKETPELQNYILSGDKKSDKNIIHTFNVGPLVSVGPYIGHSASTGDSATIGIKYITRNVTILTEYDKLTEVIDLPRSHGIGCDFKFENPIIAQSSIKISYGFTIGKWLTHKMHVAKENTHILALQQDDIFWSFQIGLTAVLE